MRIVAIAALAVLGGGAAAFWAAGRFAAAAEAYKSGNDAEALKLMRPLAFLGLSKSQYFVGVMYEQAGGVQRDPAEAAQWYRKAAEKGFAPAQFALGSLYAVGRGVRPDNVQAYMWFSVATMNGYARATAERDDVATRMTPAEIAEAEALSRQWRAKVEARASKSPPVGR